MVVYNFVFGMIASKGQENKTGISVALMHMQ